MAPMPITNRHPASPPNPASGPIAKKIAALAIPTFGQLVAEPAFVLIDTAIIGHVGDDALAGLSLGSTILLTAVGLCVFLAYSTTSHVAHLFGAGRRREGFRAGIDGLWLAACIGAVLAFALFAGARPLCAALGGSGEALEQAATYTQLVALGVPGMLLTYAATGIFRGLQSVRITLYAAAGAALVNTVLDAAFVVGLQWGIAGSGIATCIAQWFLCASLLVPVLRQARREGASLRPHMHGIAAAGGDGLPLFMRTLFLRIALVATVAAAASTGTEVLAGYQIVYAAWSFALNALDAVAIAGQTLAGAELGAKRFGRVREITRKTARFGGVAGIVVGACFAIAGYAAAPLFSPNADVQSLARIGMLVVGIGLPLQGWMWALDGILIGARDFRYLAYSMAAVAFVHVAATAALAAFILPRLADPVVQTALIWASFCTTLMGSRALACAARIRGDAWMGN